MARWTSPSDVVIRRHVSSHSSSVNTTPDGLARMASNSRSPASGPSPKPARRTPFGLISAQRWVSAHSAAALAAPSGSVGPSVRYSSDGADRPEPGVGARGRGEGGGELGPAALGGGPQRGDVGRR